MIKKSNNSVSCVEELLAFYNRFLALDNDEQYLLNLINNMAAKFIAKIPGKDMGVYGYIGDKDIMEFKFNTEDVSTLSSFDQNCLSFCRYCSFKLNDSTVLYFDKYGTVVYVNANEQNLDKYIGQNIFALLNSSEDLNSYGVKSYVYNIILQNILVSKVNQAIRERILYSKGEAYAYLFGLLYENIINYEKKLKDIYPDKTYASVSSVNRVRSRR